MCDLLLKPQNNAKWIVYQSHDYATLYETLLQQTEGANRCFLNGQWQGKAVPHPSIRKELNFSKYCVSLEKILNSRKECSLVYTLWLCGTLSRESSSHGLGCNLWGTIIVLTTLVKEKIHIQLRKTFITNNTDSPQKIHFQTFLVQFTLHFIFQIKSLSTLSTI